MSISILHNPRCSKSRQTLQLLQEKGIEPEVIEYLKTPPSAAELKSIITKLGIDTRDLFRKKEAEYKETGANDESLTEQQLLDIMVATPKLIERPIVINGDKAVIGRPPENVLDII
ncbi:arsenate reductase (glutaredoxin) [Psychrosphaera ytuae]|uniref:Arsenate reductase n=1 Tax=Psychrosphaera ytuae TaxID=2820710 RepID=A0A975DBH6_9GAMM|nr:arsenate reductase (glutaredoxin) [Psychrosphaera ytuae]QTH64100.1 arsenate reductase (glutaredoxin) [Psychrosphaera ytuae]